ncbi:MAG: 16S rRNA (adenine(1518)-N(6)/adenine(1519)-N(6))-dimethyltransferase RsmA [Candidatus Marinimicrobia bacterium]|nr:16S rRNA (adenine(1518)-N(6)/adenine(1519)-N(6))-dimethyltransferase RsmA [Candidatus Neomarinimicrobiota bacterium]
MVDDNVVRKILHTFSPRTDELIIEIGPGQGALTKYLDELGVETVAVELDEKLVDYLRGELGEESTVRIIHADVLDTDITEIAEKTDKPIRVLGNIPYNITSPLLFHLIQHRNVIVDVFLMMQKDVADRVTADPGNKSYGILSVLLQTYADTEFEFSVSRNVFRPKPRIASGCISLRWHDRWSRHIPDFDLYRVVVRTAFGKRRKTLRNALDYLPLSAFDPDTLSFDTGQRAEELDIREFIKLTREIAEIYPQYRNEVVNSEL